MKSLFCLAAVFAVLAPAAGVTVPDNLVADGVPDIPPELRARAERYLDFRSASFQGWHPQRREMLIATRFAETPQLHTVAFPGGARRQLTFLHEPVGGAAYQPRTGECIVFLQDKGGGEFFQVYRYDVATGEIVLLTDGRSRHTNFRWSPSGKFISYSSTQRNGRDTDIYVMNPADPSSARRVLQVEGGGWSASDWSRDENYLAISEYVSINESYIWVLDLRTGEKQLLTPKTSEKGSFMNPQFGGDAVYALSDFQGEFRRLVRLKHWRDKGVTYQDYEPITSAIDADIEGFAVAPDGETIAYRVNDRGTSVLRIMNGRTGEALASPKLPRGVMSGIEWHENRKELGITLASAQSSGDAFSYNLDTGEIERWTESETGGLDPRDFVEPGLVEMESFDGLRISAFVYSPDSAKHPGKRPVLVLIHGGPEGQSRPGFLGRNNYLLNEMGIALVVPNVRGSSGFGKTYLQLDNGLKREDSVKDIGTVLEWIAAQNRFDSERVAVMGGSYGGYMVLASMIHHADRLRAGIDVVGISNFLTFLKNTQDYRRDLRRAEYGDERDPEMRAFFERISPSNQAKWIGDPLFVIQGQNDPRVPASESEQMVKAIRENGGDVWYLVAKDEGHGFRKKGNQDFQFLSTIQFLECYLLQDQSPRP